MGGMAAQPTPEPLGGRRRVTLRIEGVVQGVGFRPYVYRLASSLGLAGSVRNTSRNVTIEVEGSPDKVEEFIRRLPREAPPLARIHDVATEDSPPRNADRFEILESVSDKAKGQLVSPDIATCRACLAELLDHTDRRYRYPFTNCTNCGPRFTIIVDMPYDRPNTTMASFAMCPQCGAEYTDPTDRRFHAQPNACPVCGPSLRLLRGDGCEEPCADVVARTAALLDEGHIVALKGLGGFLLACDATAPEVVGKLRERKRRPSKPFAVMVRDIETARLHCDLTEEEEALLSSPAAPIVLARWRAASTVCAEVAPCLSFLGVMLPYTPLHHLLMREFERPLVMTSGNLTEEPIAAEDDEALLRLRGIADCFVTHNRPIHSRYDDSVVMATPGRVHVLRRARGYAPYPVPLPAAVPPVLAVGPQTKNTFCLAEGHRAFVSQHIGDLDSVETFDHFERTIELYRRLFGIEPVLVAHDLHPDYASTPLARRLAPSSQALRAVQHHHAHIVACMTENDVQEPVIGVAFDGAGLGGDGHIWGGEFLVCDASTSRRAGHLEYLPLPGGDAAVLRPYRIAAAYITKLLGEHRLAECPQVADALAGDERRVLLRQMETGLNTPLTSSMGRLFDAVAAMTGVRGIIDYDAQAAIELEMAAHRQGSDGDDRRYAFDIERVDGMYIVRCASLLNAVLRDISDGVPAPCIASAFHDAVVRMTVDVCTRISEDTGIRTVALSGGVFQNRILIERTPEQLGSAGFRVLLHTLLPSNDGCVSLGQAVIAARSPTAQGLPSTT